VATESGREAGADAEVNSVDAMMQSANQAAVESLDSSVDVSVPEPLAEMQAEAVVAQPGTPSQAAPTPVLAAEAKPTVAETKAATPSVDPPKVVETPTASIAEPKTAIAHESAPSSKPSLARSVIGMVGRTTTRISEPAIKVLSWPLAGKSKTVRDSVGWVTLNTIFWCACLWTWLLFFRGPAETHAESAAFDFAHSSIPEAAKPASGHGDDAAGHADAGGHGSGTAAPADDGHGGGDGHGEAGEKAKPADRRGVARREIPNRSPSAKPKAEAKKESGSGGH
jgi:hypothetical protein